MRFLIFIFLISGLSISGQAQQTDTIFLGKNRRRAVHKDSIVFVQYLTYQNPAKTVWTDKVFYTTGEKYFEGYYTKPDGKLIREGTFRNWHKNGQLSDEYTYRQNNLEGKSVSWHLNGQKSAEATYVQNKREGKAYAWYETGQLKSEFHYVAGNQQGEGLSYYPDGKLKRREYFSKGELIKGKSFTRTGADTAFVPTYTQPSFPGGYAAIGQHIKNTLIYPDQARRNNIEGLVHVQFIVNKEGFIINPEVVKKLSPEIDAEALRIVKELPRFTPAKEEGQPVSFRFTVPIRFALTD